MKSIVSSGFDRLAPVYDFLASMVFGKAIRESQKCFLDQIKPNARVLILGGGTGRLLETLYEVQPDCEIWYVEASQKMIARARKRMIDIPAHIHFIQGTEHSIPGVKFDVVITHYFLDLFAQSGLEDVIRLILTRMDRSFIWIAADFMDQGKFWQRILLKFMYLFFRATCGIEATQLPQWHDSLLKAGLTERQKQMFFNDFIMSMALTPHGT